MSPDESRPEKEAELNQEKIVPEPSQPSDGHPEQGPTPEPQKLGAFGFHYDNEENPNRFYIEIPLDTVAADPSINGIIFLLGFFENCKNEAVAQVRRKRMRKQENNKLILPGQRESVRVH
jgi:hypothetical protein